MNTLKNILLVLVVATLAVGVAQEISAEPFDSEEWCSGDPRSRGYMVRDLIDSKVLLGMTREHALGLLGAPHHENRGGNPMYQVEESGLIPQSFLYWLELQIDPVTERVAKVSYSD